MKLKPASLNYIAIYLNEARCMQGAEAYEERALLNLILCEDGVDAGPERSARLI